MTTPHETDDRLEQGLRRSASWEGERPAPPLWDRAMQSADGVGARDRFRPLARHRLLRTWGGIGALAAILALAVIIFVPTLGRERSHRRMSTQGVLGQPASEAGRSFAYGFAATPEEVLGELGELATSRVTYAMAPVAPAALGAAQPAETPPGPDRHVVRKASMELKAADVRGTFLKVSLIPNAALGEYVEDSSVTGEGATVAANLTLRVTAERLPDVLNQVRELGTVTSEQVRGEDVTAQVVDVESRLRNERRIEQELLELLEKRQDAPLKDILELRTKLGEVRGEIERMEGQRATLSRLVSLATVLVLIRPSDTPVPAPEKSSLWSHLGDSFNAAWRTGVEFLIDSGAAIVRIGLGGLIWWAIAIAAIVTARRYIRRAALLRGDV